MAVNRDKPDRWKSDIAASVDFYNQWFLTFAPQTFRDARADSVKQVRQTISLTEQMKDFSPEIRRQQLQAQLDASKSGSERNRLGQFATPYPLAQQIISVARTYQALPAEEIRFLEPAVGLGAFYSALLDEIKGGLPETAMGFEVDPELAELSQQIWRESGLQVCNEDFTLVTPPREDTRKFNLLVTNPPYVRHHHLSRQQKQRLAQSVARKLGIKPNGLMGLYGYFVLLAHDWMQQNAVGAWLVPIEFMDVGYGAVLKKYFTHKVELLRVHRFETHDKQFADADVTSAVMFLRNKMPARDHEVLFTTGPSLTSPESSVSVPIQQLRDLPKWSSVSKPAPHHLSRTAGLGDQAVTLGDLFEIKRGLATGANHFFIMPRVEASQRGIPEVFLKPILPSPRHLRHQAIIESDSSGFPLVEPALVLLDCPVSKEQLAESYPELYRYILEGEALRLHHRYLLSRRDPWYRQEERGAAPILCGYMARKNKDGKSIRFYRNKSQAVATNVYLMLYPKPLITQCSKDVNFLLDHIFELLLTLNQRDLVYYGRTYGGGLDKIEPNELGQVVLPFTDDEELTSLLQQSKESSTEGFSQLAFQWHSQLGG